MTDIRSRGMTGEIGIIEVYLLSCTDIIDAEGKPYREVVLSSSETEQVAFLLSRNGTRGHHT